MMKKFTHRFWSFHPWLSFSFLKKTVPENIHDSIQKYNSIMNKEKFVYVSNDVHSLSAFYVKYLNVWY